MKLEFFKENIKNLFNINKNIYNKEIYLKGINPKIIITREKSTLNISGICCFYYESVNEKLLLKINTIYAIENWEDQISLMIVFIKSNIMFNKLIIPVNKEMNIDNKIKDFFEKELEMSFDDNSFIFIKNDKIKNHECEFLSINSLYILSSYNGEKINNEKINENKFINTMPVNILLNKYKKENDFINNLNEMITVKTDIKTINEVQEYLITSKKKNNFVLNENSFNEINDEYKSRNINLNHDLLVINLNQYFSSIFTIKIDKYYYNRLCIDKIININDSNIILYLIETKNPNIYLFITEINDNCRNILIEQNENIFENFVKFLTNLVITESDVKNLYLPSFKINSHLQSNKFKNFIGINLANLEEYIDISFDIDENYVNSFSYEIKNDIENFVVKNPFLIGVLNNDTSSAEKLPLLELVYVKKENWKY